MHLTERDVELFKLLSASGVCTLEQARKVYDGSKWYHYKRIDRLCKAGYLIKRGSYIELAKEGAETVGDSKYRFRHDDLRKIHSEVANIALLLGESFISSRQLRKQYGLNRRSHFKGAILHDDKQYFVYLLGEKSTRQYIASVKHEIKSLASARITDCAIVFALSPESMALFEVDSCRLQELLLLPYPAGVDMLSQYWDFKFPGAAKSNKPFAHYETNDYYITSLILNDLAKRTALDAYFQLPYSKPVKIICLPKQQKFFASQYPQAEIMPIKN